MKVYVVFDFPEISDPNSIEADNIIQCLEDDLNNLFKESDQIWYIDDAIVEEK